MSQGGSRVLFPFSYGVRTHADQYKIAFFIFSCAPDLPLSYLADLCSAKIEWLSTEAPSCYSTNCFFIGHVHVLVNAVVPSQNIDTSRMLSANRLYDARAVVWVVHSVDPGGLVISIAYIVPLFKVSPPVLRTVPDVYDVELDVGAREIYHE